MRYFKYKGKLVEEISYVQNEKVVFMKYIREEDKPRCEHCGHSVDKEITIVEGCLHWDESVKSIETIGK